MNNILTLINQLLLFVFTVLMMQITTAVNTFPQILTETYNQTLNLSSTAILTCHVRNLGDHHITWFKFDPVTSISSPLAVGNQLFTTNQRYSISSYWTSSEDSFWSLEIYQLDLSDEGIYICKIANRRATVSVYIYLHIQIPMTMFPTTAYVEPGANIQLNCSILTANNDEKSSIIWHFSSHQINKTKLHHVHIRKTLMNHTLSSLLRINHAQVFHSGIWTCVYKQQQLHAKVFVEKDILKHQRASALLSKSSNRERTSINLLIFMLYLLLKK